MVKLKQQYGSVVSINRADEGIAHVYSTLIDTLTDREQYACPLDENPTETPIEIVRGFEYTINSERGDCGAPIIIHNTSLRGKIVGIHVAGALREAYGLGVLVTYEMIVEKIGSTRFDFTETPCVTMGRIVAMGKVERPVHINRKTQLYRTKCDIFPVTKIPADLSFVDGHDQILCSIMKNGVERNSGEIDANTLALCVKYIGTKFPKNRNSTLLTWQEAIQGVDEYDGLNLTTSPGYPYVLTGGKEQFITKDLKGVYHIVNNKIIEDCKHIEHQCLTGPPEIVWLSCGKDELLRPQKACRVFEIAPMHFTLLGRRYFGRFLEYVQANPGKLYSYIGINPESMAWNQLYNRLVKTSSLGYAWDWQKYDSTIKEYLMLAFADIVNRWYNDDHSVIRVNICRALMSRQTVYGDFVLMMHGGNPSGHFATSVSNSYIQLLIIMSFWLESAPLLYRDLHYFDQMVALAIYGDDSLVAVDHRATWFTFDTFAQYVSTIGMEIQLDTKEEGTTARRPIKELTFLKRNFVKDEKSCMVPQLNWNSMTSMLLFNRKSKYVTAAEMFQNNLNTFSQFLYFYGREKYEEVVSLLGCNVPSWDYYDNLFYSDIPFPILY